MRFAPHTALPRAKGMHLSPATALYFSQNKQPPRRQQARVSVWFRGVIGKGKVQTKVSSPEWCTRVRGSAEWH